MQFQEQWDRHEKPPFTPGPWFWNGVGTIWNTTGDDAVADEVVVGEGVMDHLPSIGRVAKGEELDANCLLMAAAPGLFAALDAAPVIRLGESFEEFGVRYSRWYREMKVPALKKAYGG